MKSRYFTCTRCKEMIFVPKNTPSNMTQHYLYNKGWGREQTKDGYEFLCPICLKKRMDVTAESSLPIMRLN